MTISRLTTVLALGAVALLPACKSLPDEEATYSKPATAQTPRDDGPGTNASSRTGRSSDDAVDPGLRRRPPPAPTYSESYERDPNRPSPAEARAQAAHDFEKMVNPKVLEMLRLLNAEREKNGLTTVVLEPRLMAAALREAKDMAEHGHLSHVASDGSHMEDRIADVQYYYTKIAENIAATKPTAAGTFRQWVTSKRHYEQMMITGATQAGIAYAHNPNRPTGGLHLRYYWVLLIGRPHPFHD